MYQSYTDIDRLRLKLWQMRLAVFEKIYLKPQFGCLALHKRDKMSKKNEINAMRILIYKNIYFPVYYFLVFQKIPQSKEKKTTYFPVFS